MIYHPGRWRQPLYGKSIFGGGRQRKHLCQPVSRESQAEILEACNHEIKPTMKSSWQRCVRMLPSDEFILPCAPPNYAAAGSNSARRPAVVAGASRRWRPDGRLLPGSAGFLNLGNLVPCDNAQQCTSLRKASSPNQILFRRRRGTETYRANQPELGRRLRNPEVFMCGPRPIYKIASPYTATS
jgi:hypothetical protein